jgi:hypothetical protein
MAIVQDLQPTLDRGNYFCHMPGHKYQATKHSGFRPTLRDRASSSLPDSPGWGAEGSSASRYEPEGPDPEQGSFLMSYRSPESAKPKLLPIRNPMTALDIARDISHFSKRRRPNGCVVHSKYRQLYSRSNRRPEMNAFRKSLARSTDDKREKVSG